MTQGWETLWQMVGADAVTHSSRTLRDHLQATAGLLQAWGARPAVVAAGALHSVYGTSRFDAGLPVDRARVRTLVGDEVERLVDMFGRLERDRFLATAGHERPELVCRRTGERLATDLQTVADIAMLVVANWAEQASRHAELRRGRTAAALPELAPWLLPAAVDPCCALISVEPPTSQGWAGLAELLTFADPVPWLRTLRRLVRNHRRELVRELLAEPALERQRDQLLALPPALQQRIVTSPEVCRHLRDPSVRHRLPTLLRDAILAEEALAGSMAVDRDRWTVLGDVRMRADGRTERATILPGGLILDFDSPEVARPLAPFHGEPFSEALPYDADQRARVTERFTEALLGLQERFPVRFLLVVHALQVVQPQQRASTGFRGSTSGAEIGRMNSYNPHIAGVDAGMVAQSLFHEAVHTFLYLSEQAGPPWFRGPYATMWSTRDEDLVTSPFTGSRLCVYAYVHSYVVWSAVFGLFAEESNPWPGAAERYVAQCRRGFTDGRALEVLEPFRARLSDGMWDALRVLQDRAEAPWTA